MPQLGEIKRSYEIGHKGWYRNIWVACTVCGKERWVQIRKGKPAFNRCHVCKNKATLSLQHRKREGSPVWKGGRVHSNGYISILINPNDFFYSMASTKLRGYVAEHRLVMARYLGRCLLPWEQVHHKDGNRSNNDINNLELTTRANHISDHNKGYQDGYNKGLTDGRLKQIQQLKTEVAHLQRQSQS